MSPFVMTRMRCRVDLTWGKPPGLGSSSITVGGLVMVASAGVSEGGGCIEVSSGWFTELVFAVDVEVVVPPCV